MEENVCPLLVLGHSTWVWWLPRNSCKLSSTCLGRDELEVGRGLAFQSADGLIWFGRFPRGLHEDDKILGVLAMAVRTQPELIERNDLL